MRLRNVLLFLALGMLILSGASAATALTPAKWTRITDSNGSILGEVSLARTADGVLHVAWARPTPAHPNARQDLLDRTISPGGVLGPSSLVVGDWASIENPALVATGGVGPGGVGLDLFAGAIRSLSPHETITNLAFFSSADGGASWSSPSEVTDTGSPYAADVSAAIGSAETPFEAWGSSACLCVHRGTMSSTPNVNFQAGLGDFGYEPGIAVDPVSGRMIVAWYSNATHHSGVYAAAIDQATGAMSGSRMRMPGTSSLQDGPFSGRTQVVGRPGGGVYVAYEAGYPSLTKVLLWRVGASSSTVIDHDSLGVGSVGIAATPAGRLWVFWSSRSSSDTPLVHVRRSNPGATQWGATVTIKPPQHANTSWNLVGNGQSTRLDLVGSFTTGSTSQAASWYTRLLPGLALEASPSRLRRGTARAEHVTFSVFDAGAPVAGARVLVGRVKGVTNHRGKVTLSLGPFRHRGHVTAEAVHGGYSAARLTVKIR